MGIFDSPHEMLIALIWNTEDDRLKIALSEAVVYLISEDEMDNLALLEIFASCLAIGHHHVGQDDEECASDEQGEKLSPEEMVERFRQQLNFDGNDA